MVKKDSFCKCGTLIWSNTYRCKACDTLWRKSKYLGKNNPFFGKKHSKETKEKMKQNSSHHRLWLGKHHTEATKEKLKQIRIDAISKGWELSPEAKKKHRASLKGRLFSDTHRMNLSLAYNKELHTKYVLKHTEEFKRKLSERNLNNWQDAKYVNKMKHMFWNTKPECEMKEILTSLKIEFIHIFRIANIAHSTLVDFYLPDSNTVIETDGKYWHDYPYGNEIDHIRTGEMRDAGYNVLRFWENEFDKDSVYNSLKK